MEKKWLFVNSSETENKAVYRAVFAKYESYLYITLIFLVPFFLGHIKGIPNQIFVGSTVNALLALGAFYTRGKKIFLIILLPVVAALASGLVFGPVSMFLIYFIPFIWIANWAYVKLLRFIKNEKKMNLGLAVACASLVKAGFLLTVAFVLVSLNIVPAIFLTAMGVLQLVTAVIGGTFSAAVYKFREQ